MSSIAALIRKIIPKRFRPIGYLEHLVSSRTGGRVKGGPFAGMKYIGGAVGSAYVPKLLGIYERELGEKIEEACTLHFPLIVDVGAAEGYYATGMALRNPRSRIVAFEMEEKGRAALKEMARINEVGPRIEVRGKCGPTDLQLLLHDGGNSFILCDSEGDEELILDPVTVPALKQAYMLVEMHDFIRAGVTERVLRRFRATHDIEQIWQEPRKRDDMPWRTVETFLLPRRYLDWAVSEWRPVQMSWLWMKPRRDLRVTDMVVGVAVESATNCGVETS